jgi:hypothetical protein
MTIIAGQTGGAAVLHRGEQCRSLLTVFPPPSSGAAGGSRRPPGRLRKLLAQRWPGAA